MIQTATPRKRNRAVRVGPEDNGRRMSLDEFDRAIGTEGWIYELHRGVVEVSDVPSTSHFFQLQSVRKQLLAYDLTHPDVICAVTASNESKILLSATESERHPDLSVYLKPPAPSPDVWSRWVPEIVIEIVSPSSVKRDYEDKPTDYLLFGVDEYWIIDSIKQQMTALIRWRGEWKPQVIKPPQKYTTDYLPGFKLDLKRVLTAGERLR